MRSRLRFPWAALAIALSCWAPAAEARSGLSALERKHERATEAHHDVTVNIARARAERAELQARWANLTAAVSRLRGEEGLRGRAKRKDLRAAQNLAARALSDCSARLRELSLDERLARMELVLARSDLARRYLELAGRPTARQLGDGPQRTAHLEAARRVAAAERLTRALQDLQRLEPSPTPSLEGLIDPQASDAELRALQEDLLETVDRARERAERLTQIEVSRGALARELTARSRFFPRLAEAAEGERRALASLKGLRDDLLAYAGRALRSLHRIDVLIVERQMRRLREEAAGRG